MADLSGVSLGPYRIIERIGRGGMATVYKAYHAATDRHVAIKVLPEEYADDPDFLTRFEREAKTVAKLQHPHIVPVFDYGQEHKINYLVMPYIPSGTLKDHIAVSAPLPLSETGRILANIAQALDYAHQQGVIHRDIKPDNILFDENGNALLSDFGLTRMTEGSHSLTGTGVIGTPAYMSPEQGQGMHLDQRSDIYSIGIIVYEMVTGQVPYSADTPVAVIFKHVNEPLPLPTTKRPDLPELLQNVILKALAKEPDQRWSSCNEMASTFLGVLNQQPITTKKDEDAITVAGIQPITTGYVSDTPTTSIQGKQDGFRWFVGFTVAITMGLLAILIFSKLFSSTEVKSTPILTALPAPTGIAEELIYHYDFSLQKPVAEDWQYDANTWTVQEGKLVSEPQNELASGDLGIRFRTTWEWLAYEVKFQFLLEPETIFVIKFADVQEVFNAPAYLEISPQGVHINTDFDEYQDIDIPIEIGVWHTAEFSVHGHRVSMRLDDVELFSNMLLRTVVSGWFEFSTHKESATPVFIDDVFIYPIEYELIAADLAEEQTFYYDFTEELDIDTWAFNPLVWTHNEYMGALFDGDVAGPLSIKNGPLWKNVTLRFELQIRSRSGGLMVHIRGPMSPRAPTVTFGYQGVSYFPDFHVDFDFADGLPHNIRITLLDDQMLVFIDGKSIDAPNLEGLIGYGDIIFVAQPGSNLVIKYLEIGPPKF